MKYFLTLLLITGFLGIPGCLITNCDETLPYWNITEFELSLRGSQWNEYSNQVFTEDSLRINLEFEHNFISHFSSPLISSSLATERCPDSGEQGPKDLILDIEVTSKTTFNEYQPGQLLNPLIQGTPIPTNTLEEWVNDINNQMTPYSSTIFFTKKPEQQLQRTFTVKLIFDSGKELSATTQPITW
jgi:hypothetical protein